jgi:hypothetical protein
MTSDHPALLEAAQRALALDQLAWLRRARVDDEAVGPSARLLGDEGKELVRGAVRDGYYAPADAPFVARQLADLARAAELREARELLAELLRTQAPFGHAAELPRELMLRVLKPLGREAEPGSALRALASALAPHARRFVELRERGEQAYTLQLAAAEHSLGAPLPAAEPSASEWRERAEKFLAQTDDPARELTRWLMKRAAAGGRSSDDIGQLLATLRAPELEGLAKPGKRFYRVAAGARALGFEADMSARLRAEPGAPLFLPLGRTIVIALPGDIRVTQPGLEYGIASDLAAAQGLGEGLALCLVSPGLSPLRRRASEATDSVCAALGGLFLQLRADAGYLRRIDAFDADPAERAGRHAGMCVLLRARWAAALLLVEQAPARDARDRIQQLMAASERALGRALPEAIAALALLTAGPRAHDFAALARGYELHAALRERYDLDFYSNPRVSEVLRGAAARGGTLTAEQLGVELAASPEAGIARAIELLA